MHKVETTPNTILDAIEVIDIGLGLMRDQLDEFEIVDKDDQEMHDSLIAQYKRSVEVREDLQSLLPWYVVEYEVSREFGGPEEGGWYYDWYQRTSSPATITTSEAQADWLAQVLTSQMQSIKKENRQNDRFSVVGTPDTVWIAEKEPGRHESKTRPHYE